MGLVPVGIQSLLRGGVNHGTCWLCAKPPSTRQKLMKAVRILRRFDNLFKRRMVPATTRCLRQTVTGAAPQGNSPRNPLRRKDTRAGAAFSENATLNVAPG
jgi:hypothetical protein